MPKVSRAAVEDRLARMAAEIDAIDATRPSTLADYLAPGNDTLRVALEHRIFMAAQAMVDIAAHIVAAQGYGAPPTYRDALDQLALLGVVSRDTIDGVAGAAGLRNAIAHLYLGLDQGQVYEGLQRTPEMKRYAAEVWAWLERQRTARELRGSLNAPDAKFEREEDDRF